MSFSRFLTLALLAAGLRKLVRRGPLALIVELGKVGRHAFIASAHVHAMPVKSRFIVDAWTKQSDARAGFKPQVGKTFPEPQ